ncbi:coiled-coil domain-containing protein 92 [Brachyhypopomus gauderio]|uniref:coiled-coil domain-containing protein 92 n=1 Tax=Brachyhypopomus gauderio TaxID=698409 RepID=UPI0040424B8E
MASENVTLENQLHSAQKNLLFLQQDHANTLKGLHAEIRHLQQHCTDLTYELTVRSSDPNDNGEERCRELHRRCEELEEQLKAKEQENAELLRDLEQKNAMISVLENTIREREKKYLDELKHRSHKLAVLSGELEQRASTIAYLTSQLHATKKRLLAGGSSGTSPTVSPMGSFRPAPPPAPATPPAPPPAPPTAADRDSRQPDTPRRRMRKSLSQPLHCEYTELYRLGAADGRRVVLRDAVDAMPDPTPFLQAREPPAPAETAPLLRERPPVIPPIVPAATSPAHVPIPPNPRGSPARDRPHRGTAHIGVAHRIHRSSSAGGGARAQAEVETLAVDQVSGEKVVRKQSETDRTV